MARHLRVEYPGAIYHVTCRMIGDQRLEHSRLFVDDGDRERFLERLAERVEQYNIRLYLFVCMTNHFHLVFETPEGNCSKFMQSLSTAYTVYYNLRHGRHGHLLDGRFKAKLVEGDDYLLGLSRYVHLNPVRIGAHKETPLEVRTQFLRQYPWSSYQRYIGKRKGLDFVECAPLLALMGGKRRQWTERYRRYVESGLAAEDKEFKAALKASPRGIGSREFLAWIDELYQKMVEGHEAHEDISFRHMTEAVPAETILKAAAEELDVEVEAFGQRRRNSPLRAVAARILLRFGGQTQREVAAELGIGTGGAVSAQVRRLARMLSEDKRLGRQLEKIEERLGQVRRDRQRAGKR